MIIPIVVGLDLEVVSAGEEEIVVDVLLMVIVGEDEEMVVAVAVEDFQMVVVAWGITVPSTRRMKQTTKVSYGVIFLHSISFFYERDYEK